MPTYILEARVDDSGNIKVLSPDQLNIIKSQHKGELLVVTVQPAVEMTAKQKMNRYYHGPLLDTLNEALLERGYAIPKGGRKLYFESRFAAEEFIDTINKDGDKVVEAKRQSISDMTKDELAHFIDACIEHLWDEFNIEAPDALEYRVKKRLGK